jgi:hypothetical protein
VLHQEIPDAVLRLQPTILAAFAGLTRSAVALRFARRLMGGVERNYLRWNLQSHGPLHREQRASAVRSSPGAPRNTPLI